MNRYSGLTRRLDAERGDETTLMFSEIEKLIGGPLPPKASTPEFWNISLHRPHFHGVKRAIADAGFGSQLLIGQQKVHFARRVIIP